MNWKAFISGYLTFSRKDRIGAFTLVLLILIIYILPYLVPEKVAPPIILDDSLKSWLDKTDSSRVAGYQSAAPESGFGDATVPLAPEPNAGSLFPFDPNSLDEAGWKRLGLRERTARTIINYRNKGGRFYRKEDLQKIWGLPKNFYQRVAPYIKIQTNASDQPEFAKREINNELKTYPSKTIDINTADTSEWIALPGIGSKMASRIVNFRAKLGGFVSIEQVGTTYGLQDSIFQKIKPKLKLTDPQLSKIKINTASKEELSAHPYIKWEVAKSIVAYRQQHGPIKSKKDLEQLMLLDEKALEQLLPYLQFD
ncbi:competence protein ComEA helix-hairpin-helix repeat region [Cnuella takakiae]|uniref:Competence protein ComEA helix-hairpin-helix repeat region n=1 Tax=Cnuella takakiae TaxID=1302690 RepID=A0A1M4ZY28_9BACT|nr:helix-hairpin-helix domain-containing protein [Cnuella takakiae]OLY92175.1 hypothetical protein BUE76_09925 [Cnuella takakiae]SHF22526.1 competence protein ComEA helix-hairpin-helix repeat region [Cnuella takakiae]